MARVLVVDDHATNRDLIATLLGYAGHQVDEASDGAEALEKVRTGRPALVICDILMPTMDGYQFVRRLREEPGIAGTEVIFCTATFMEGEARQLAASCGVHRILFKPCEPQDVLDVVQAALAGQGPAAPAITVDDFDREHLRLVTDKLVAQSNELQRANERLSALTDLNLRLASERDPFSLLDQVCRGARDLIGARYAILGVRHKNGEERVHYTSWGLDPQAASELALGELDQGVLGTVMKERTPRRFFNPSRDPARLGLPASCPPFTTGLVAPVVSLHQSYGWILLIDKTCADAFSDEDEHLLAIHAAQAGRIYENGSLYQAMKHSAEQLKIANETLEQRVESRTAQLREIISGLESFNRTVSHDLRGPLGGIAGASRKAGEYLEAGQLERAGQMLGLIAQSAERTERLVNALLALARASETELRRQRVDTQALVSEVVASLPQPADRPPVQVTVRDLPPVDADPTLLRQVFVNLLTNALKFASAGPAPQVEVGAGEERGHIVFFVRDNGVGFSEAQAERLFHPFQRLHGARFEGFGLGLSIVRRIIERHQGQIRAEGRPGQGAAFYFSTGSGP
ncbi:MAG TPA: response regulator [Rhizobacter sp.]